MFSLRFGSHLRHTLALGGSSHAMAAIRPYCWDKCTSTGRDVEESARAMAGYGIEEGIRMYGEEPS
jgi:hypothetical protein